MQMLWREQINMSLFIIFSLFFLIFYREKEFIIVCAVLLFVLGVTFDIITFSEISFRHISGIVSEIQYDNNGESRRRNPSLIIFLESHLEPLKFTAKKDLVRKVRGRLKKGDKVIIVVEDIFDNIWGITVGKDEILSFAQEKEETKYNATFLILYGAFLFIIVFYRKNIFTRVSWFKKKFEKRR